MKYYLAVDMGASSGRHILCHMESGRMILEEIHRFENGMTLKDGEKVWDVDRLYSEIIAGLKKCKAMGKIPSSIGIDTWGVDFVLLDEEGKRLGNAVGYRDERTRDMDEILYTYISENELYARTGIQKQIFNTIYQLESLKVKKPDLLNKANALLMIPDYFNYLLTGVMRQEYTNATTGQLVSPDTKDWDYELIDRLGFPRKIFQKIEKPGYVLGNLKPEIANEVGFDAKVILPATHDTGSAVVAVPSSEDKFIYISSGTWSLMGTELEQAECGVQSEFLNFTNEGGYDYRFRYLKNIMGLWMIQSVRSELAPGMSYGEICEGASKCKNPPIVDANDSRFLAPENMTEEIRNACRETGQIVPQNIFEVAAVIYNSLAKCYAKTVKEIESVTHVKYDHIYVVGGGANAEYLNRLTRAACGCRVYAGPTEATAIGNIAVQMMSEGDISSLKEARKLIFDSFAVKEYE